MNTQQIELVQASFEKVRPIADQAAETFYQRLFEIAPGYRSFFKHDMKKQGAMLMSMIASAVRGLSKPDALLPVLTMLGRRHAGYGVVDAHYTTVAQALLWTLEEGLGEDFTPEVRDAWVAAYTLMATVMQQGARDLPRAA